MSLDRTAQFDLLQQLIGARDEQISVLRARLEKQDPAMRAWQKLQLHRRDLAEWLIEAATGNTGLVHKPIVDAALGGEMFVPCSMVSSMGGRRYALNLVSTEYEIR